MFEAFGAVGVVAGEVDWVGVGGVEVFLAGVALVGGLWRVSCTGRLDWS